MDNSTFLIWAVALGALSAVSLPLGSLLGLSWQPGRRIVAAMTAFGGGALIAALSVELVAPTAMAVTGGGHGGGHGGHGGSAPLLALLGSAVVGGLLFIILDQLVNAQGGFLRKTATSIAFMSRRRAARDAHVLEQLSRVKLMREIPSEKVGMLVSLVRRVSFQDGETLFTQGDEGDGLYFIESGTLKLKTDGKHFKDLGAGDVVGEIALLANTPRTATAVADGPVNTLMLLRRDFDQLRAELPELARATTSLAGERLEELASRREAEAQRAAEWASNAREALETRAELPSAAELRAAKEEHAGAPLAIWLGILLDGIPESFVIGASLVGIIAGKLAASGGQVAFMDVVPWTLIAGLFLANFPEAMSSSIGMRAQGWGKTRVFMMWFVLMVITGIGAGLGYWIGGAVSHTTVVAIEGLAAGAMLTMIAAAMVPEAVHLGGSTVTGMGTLAGFIAAVSFKLLE